VIDLHLHTAVSDGRLSPSSLVSLAAASGLRIISVTDHDTVAGLADARAAAALHGIRVVPGIEITAVDNGRDVHVLGYFFDPEDAALGRFLQAQRAERIDRVREIGARLQSLGYSVDVEAIVDTATHCTGRSIGRPLVADALIAGGHAVDRSDAFDRLLADGRPGFVPRCGPPVADVVRVVSAAGGLTSLAHPGLLDMDARIPQYAESGLAAIEVRHREHDATAEAHYRHMARDLNLAVSGGSDFHGEPTQELGSVTLDPHDFDALEARRTALRDVPPRRRGTL
jgi:predicted metal-dependent phosphoesterase TrpH